MAVNKLEHKVQPYPLQFEPQFKERIWGGQALARFGLNLPDGTIGEAWMISDHPHGITAVNNGILAGTGLDVIRETYGETWFGKYGKSENSYRFPLLVKLLDCNDDLSVQVHPTDDYNKLPQGELGKTEMWYILSAENDAKIVYGLKEHTTKELLTKAINEGNITEHLHEVKVKAGDAFFIPAGTVHALCKGVVVAEIQQNSDTTYRLYDYNRPGLDGKLRELHIEDSLNVINFDNAGVGYIDTTYMNAEDWLTLATCSYFIVNKGIISKKTYLNTDPKSFEILVIAEGLGMISWGEHSQPVEAGQCYLLPATLGTYALAGNLSVLRCHVPDQN